MIRLADLLAAAASSLAGPGYMPERASSVAEGVDHVFGFIFWVSRLLPGAHRGGHHPLRVPLPGPAVAPGPGGLAGPLHPARDLLVGHPAAAGAS